ncbi:MAG: hypothetical protein CMH70_08960 [Nitrosomonadaceae bacterium]|nr:hypothetical protein [Nitrosomonadaceae bacterium]
MLNIHNTSNYQLCLRLMSHAAPYWLALTLTLFSTVLVATTHAVIPIFIESMLDSIFVKRNSNSIEFIPLIIIILFIVRNLSDCISLHGTYWISNTLTTSIQIIILNKILRLPTYHHQYQAEEKFSSELTSNITQITDEGIRSLFSFIRNLFTIIGLLIWIIYLNWDLSLLALMIGPIILLSMRVTHNQSHRADKKKLLTTKHFLQTIKESIENQQVILLHGGQQNICKRFQNGLDQIQQSSIQSTNILRDPLIHIIVAIVLSPIFYLSIQNTFTDEVTVASFISFIISILILYLSLTQLIKASESLQNCLSSAKDIFYILDLETEPDLGKIVLNNIQGKIEFKNISCNKTLQNISFVMRPKEKTALVGSSDEAINTLVNLLPRLIQPSNGEVLLDNHELTNIKLESLRSKIGFLSTKIKLFNDSIAANIAFGDMGHSTESEIIAAAHASHAIEFIKKMPQGMQTLVGVNGIKLSREQNQHIAIARLFLRNPPILILDEITTILDPKSEKLIRLALDNLMRNRTTLIIARRKETLKKVDRIIVIEKNRIVESGSHKTLLSEKGLYEKIYPLYH